MVVFFFGLNNNLSINSNKRWLTALRASKITTRRLHLLKQIALQNLIAYFTASWAAILQHLLTQLKLQFRKNLWRSSILLIIVAMDQLGCNLDVVRKSKQDLASPSMMICYQFSLRARLVYCNNYYMGIGISITRNILSWNVISITIH